MAQNYSVSSGTSYEMLYGYLYITLEERDFLKKNKKNIKIFPQSYKFWSLLTFTSPIFASYSDRQVSRYDAD